MNLAVSPDLVNLFKGLTGMEWPQMDTDRMYELADVYRQTAKSITDKLPELFDNAVQTLTGPFKMNATDPFVASMLQFTRGEPNYLAQLGESASELGDFVAATAADAEYTKWMIIAQLVELMIEIAVALALAPFTMGESLANLTWEYLFSREFITTALKWLLKSIAQHVVLGVATGVAMDRIIQRIQINEHHRADFDNELLDQAVEFGAIGGVLAGPIGKLGEGLGTGLGKLVGKDFAKLLSDKLGTALGEGLGANLGKEATRAFADDLAANLKRGLPGIAGTFSAAGAARFGNIVGTTFAKHLGDLLGEDAARELGRGYAKAFAASWGTEALEGSLRSTVDAAAGGLSGDAAGVLRSAGDSLARDVPAALRDVLRDSPKGTLRYRAGAQVGQTAGDWLHGNLTEGFYNLIFDPSHSFHTSWLTGAAVAGMSRAHHIAHHYTHLLGDKLFPNKINIPALLRDHLGSAAAPVPVTAVGGPHPEPPPSDASTVPPGPSGPSHDVTPPPSRTATDDPRTAGWQDRQQDLAHQYDQKFADLSRVQGAVERLDPKLAHDFTEWTAGRLGDGSMGKLADAFGLPHQEFTPDRLTLVSERARQAVVDKLSSMPVVEGHWEHQVDEVLSGLPDEFDRQAVKLATELAGDRMVTRSFDGWRAHHVALGTSLSEEVTAHLTEQATTAVREHLASKLDEWSGTDLPARIGHAMGLVSDLEPKLTTSFDLELGRLAATSEAAGSFDEAARPVFDGKAGLPETNEDPITGVLAEFREQALEHLRREYLGAVTELYQKAFGHLDPFGTGTHQVPADHGVGDWERGLGELNGKLLESLKEAASWEEPLARHWTELSATVADWRRHATRMEPELFRRFGLADRELSPAGLRAVQRAFFAALGDAFRAEHGGGWDERASEVISSLPRLVAREVAREAALSEADRAFTDHLDRAGVLPLGQEAVDRVRAGFRERAGDAFGQGIEHWDGWLAKATAGLGLHFDFEADAAAGLRSAGTMFEGIARGRTVRTESHQELSDGFRTDWFHAFHETWAPSDSDAHGWLDHESRHENNFQPARPATTSRVPATLDPATSQLVVHTATAATGGSGGSGAGRREAPASTVENQVVHHNQASPGEVHPVDMTWIHPFTGVVTRARFDLALRDASGTAELTVKVALKPGPGVTGGQLAETWAALRDGVRVAFNDPGHVLRSGRKLVVTVLDAGEGPAHLTVALDPAVARMDQFHWALGMRPMDYAHEIGHQLGLREENRHPGDLATLLHVNGTLMGDYNQPGTEGLPQGGLRQRHTDLIENIIESAVASHQGGAGITSSVHHGPSEPYADGLSVPRLPSLGPPTLAQVNKLVDRLRLAGDPVGRAFGPRVRPLTDAEAAVWVAGTTRSPYTLAPFEPGGQWEFLRELENRAGVVRGGYHAGTGPRPTGTVSDARLDRRVRVSNGSAVPARRPVVEFTDGHRMPGVLTGSLARTGLTLPSHQWLVSRLSVRLGLPDAVLRRLGAALRDRPDTFLRQGRRFRYTGGNGALHEVVVRLANHGNWDRYPDRPRGTERTGTDTALHIDDAAYHVEDTVVHGAARTTRTVAMTIHGGLRLRLADDLTTGPDGTASLPVRLDFRPDRPPGPFGVDGMDSPLADLTTMMATLFPDLAPDHPHHAALLDYLDGPALEKRLPALVSGWQQVPGTDPIGVRVRAVPGTGLLANASHRPPVVDRTPSPTKPGSGLGGLGSQVFQTLTAGPRRRTVADPSGWHGVYDTDLRLEIQRLDGRHQPLGEGGRQSYPVPLHTRLRLGRSEADRLAGQVPPPNHRSTGGQSTAPPLYRGPAIGYVTAHGGDGNLVGLTVPRPDVSPAVRPVGIPRGTLPHLEQVVSTLRKLAAGAGVTIPQQVWDGLPQRLLTNYPHAVGGLMVPLGDAEALITIDPTHPWEVSNPGGSFDSPSPLESVDGKRKGADDVKFHSNQATNGKFQTGAHSQSQGGNGGGLRLGASLGVGLGLGPGLFEAVKFSAGVNGTANQIGRSTNHSKDAEGGQVMDSREESTLLAYLPNWSVKLRTGANRAWDTITPTPVDGPADEKLLLWVPNHYQGVAGPQVTARPPTGLHAKLPDTLHASGLTDLPGLFDDIVSALDAEGLTLPIGSQLRDELTQKLWNLDTHLGDAVNDGGYLITLHDAGRVVAQVRVNTTRADEVSPRVGGTSGKAHVEQVRTAIAGSGGSQTITNSTQLSLSAEGNLVPLPGTHLGPSLSGSLTWTNTDGLSASRVGLWVLVSRYAGLTSGHHVSLSHTASVTVRTGPNQPPRTTPPRSGTALLRLTEPDAFKHGFQTDSEALKPNPTGGPADEYRPDAVRNTGPRPNDPVRAPLPKHVLAGHGVGQGLTKVDHGTPESVLGMLVPELRRNGFLPPDGEQPFRDAGSTHDEELDSQFDNDDLLRKMVSWRGFDTHYDQLHQDGMSFTLRRPTGALFTHGRLRSARITITASQELHETTAADGNRESDYFVRRTDEYHTVNLGMGMDISGPSVGGGKKFAIGAKLKGYHDAAPWLKFLNGGVEYQRSVGATESLTYLVNRPELLEYPGDVDEFRLPSTYTVTVEYDSLPDPVSWSLANQLATVHLLPHFNNPRLDGDPRTQPTEKAVIDKAVVYYFDATGTLPAARALLPDLTGPGAAADQEVVNFTSTLSMRAHAKEILSGEYTTDQFFQSGLLRDRHGALSVSGSLGDSSFAGSTDDKYVVGLIKLWLLQATQSGTSSHGVTWEQFDLGLGGAEDGVNLGNELDLNRHWGWNDTRSSTRTGGKELLELDFHRAYAFRTTVDLTVRGTQERHAKLLPSTSDKPGPGQVPRRTMVYVLSEPEALARYAENQVPIDDYQLDDALTRWQAGELRLSGNVVAGVLTRRHGGVPTPALRDWAAHLAQLHDGKALTIGDEQVRERFAGAFRLSLGPYHNPYAHLTMPEYLTRRGPRAMGHSGVHDLTFDDGPSAYKLVRNAVDTAAPGLLARDPELWRERGGVIGRLQGGIDSLQGLLSGGREHAVTEDLMHTEGQSFYLANPVGPALADVVELNLRYELTTAPDVQDFVPDTGLENYDHGYVTHGRIVSQDRSQTVNPVKFSAAGGENTSGNAQLGFSEGRHRSSNRSEVTTTEQTVYDWTGHYRVGFGHTLHVRVRRLGQVNRPVNNMAVSFYRKRRGLDRQVDRQHHGNVVLKVPRGLAEASRLAGPSPLPNLTGLPSWPGDGYVTAALLDDAQQVGRKLLRELFGPAADNPKLRGSLSTQAMLSRTHLKNHLWEALAQRRYKLGDDLFLPGHSSDRATIWLTGDLFDLEVLAPVNNATGTGRYAKHQSGTTVNRSTDRWQPSASGGADQSGTLDVVDPANAGKPWATDTSDGSLSSTVPGSRNQNGGGTDNYRREQHVKQQGPVYLVRLRGRFHLEAERWHHELIGPAWKDGSPRSDPFSGDVYAELFADEVHELRHRIANQNAAAVAATDPADWPRPTGRTPRFGLQGLLHSAAGSGHDARDAHGGVVRSIRTRGGARGHVVLTSSAAEQVIRTHRAVLDWAVDQLADDPNLPVLATLRRRQQDLAGIERQALRDAGALNRLSRYTNEMINVVNARRPSGPAELPPEVSVLAVDPVHTARRVAHELESYVDVEHTALDGTVTRHRVDPTGRLYRLDANGHPVPFTAALSELDPALRAAVGESGLTVDDLSRLYEHSWSRQQTFQQAVSAEVRRLGVGGPAPTEPAEGGTESVGESIEEDVEGPWESVVDMRLGLVTELGPDGFAELRSTAADLFRGEYFGLAGDKVFTDVYPSSALHAEPADQVASVVGEGTLTRVAVALMRGPDRAIAMIRALPGARPGGGTPPPDLNRPTNAQLPTLTRLGREARWTPADGDCYFSALLRAAREAAGAAGAPAAVTTLAGWSIVQLRQELDHRLAGPSQVLDLLREQATVEQVDFEAFLTELRTPGRWTHALFDTFLTQVPTMLGVNVTVIRRDGVEEDFGTGTGPILYLVHTGNHYLPALLPPVD